MAVRSAIPYILWQEQIALLLIEFSLFRLRHSVTAPPPPPLSCSSPPFSARLEQK